MQKLPQRFSPNLDNTIHRIPPPQNTTTTQNNPWMFFMVLLFCMVLVFCVVGVLWGVGVLSGVGQCGVLCGVRILCLSRFMKVYIFPQATKNNNSSKLTGYCNRSEPQEPQGFPDHRGFSRDTGVWNPHSEGLQISGLKGHKSEEIHSLEGSEQHDQGMEIQPASGHQAPLFWGNYGICTPILMYKLDPESRATESSGQMLHKNVTDSSTRHRSEITNHKDLYRGRPKLSNQIATRRMGLAGHCHWHKALPGGRLVLWEPTLRQGHRSREAW